jgi:hemerythrin
MYDILFGGVNEEYPMKKIQWSDGLSINLEPIDIQHQKWIEHYNEVVEAIESQKDKAHIAKTLGFLSDYTNTHFAAEEDYMGKNQYPEFQEHKAKHEALRQTVADLIQDFDEEGVTSALADAIETLLGNWLIQHIQQVDQLFGKFMQEKK